jgi:2'-hydroxyisoflavone reductase
MTMVDVLETCRRVAGAKAELEWVDGEFLVEQQVGPWMELPLWVGPEEGNFMRASVERALANGLRIRRLEKTVVDTLGWARSGEASNDPPAGLEREKEQRVLTPGDRTSRREVFALHSRLASDEVSAPAGGSGTVLIKLTHYRATAALPTWILGQ